MQTGPTLLCPSLVYSDHCYRIQRTLQWLPPNLHHTGFPCMHKKMSVYSLQGLPWRFLSALRVSVDWTTLRCKLYLEGYFNKDKPIIHKVLKIDYRCKSEIWVESCIGADVIEALSLPCHPMPLEQHRCTVAPGILHTHTGWAYISADSWTRSGLSWVLSLHWWRLMYVSSRNVIIVKLLGLVCSKCSWLADMPSCTPRGIQGLFPVKSNTTARGNS